MLRLQCSMLRPLWGLEAAGLILEAMSARGYIAGIINLPENLDVECIIAIGYPDEEPVPYKEEELRYNQVSYRSYGKTLI